MLMFIYWCNKRANANTCDKWTWKVCCRRQLWAQGNMKVCVHAYVCDPPQPGSERWITVETHCEPVGKQCNYDVLGSKVSASPLAIGYSNILHCITWPITLCVSEWFIAPVPDLVWQAVGNERAIALYVPRLGLIRLIHTTHTYWCILKG